MNSITKNIIYKVVLIFSNYIFGFITFPYITRVLGSSEFGLVNFAISLTDYFLLFATMGVATIGTREIASCRSDSELLSNQFSKILGINLLFTIISVMIYILFIFLVPRFQEHSELFLVGAAKIIFSAFVIEWFFTGLENFRYITIRSFLIRLIYVAAVFIFVKSPEDYFLYFVLTILTVVVNACINFAYSTRFVKVAWKKLKDFSFFKQNIQLGFYMIMTSMYITFNVVYLGLVSDDSQVGYYSAAVKLYFIAVNLFSAFTSVMIPRMSALKSEDNWRKGEKYIQKSYLVALSFSTPITILGVCFAPEIIGIMSGVSFMNSILPMRILMGALVFVCVAQVLVFQGFIPLKKDKYLTIASLIGGSFALLLNFIVTPRFHAIGSAIVLVTSEIVITLYYICVVRIKKFIPLISWGNLLRSVVNALAYGIISIISLWVFRGIIAFIAAVSLSLAFFYLQYKTTLNFKAQKIR